MNYSSVIALHLDNFSTPIELGETIKDAGLDDKGINVKEVFDLKADGFDILYLDVNTGNALAYHVKGMIASKVVPMQPFMEHLVKLECVSKIITQRPLNVDEILEQITKGGMKSLTDRQVKFLDHQSQAK